MLSLVRLMIIGMFVGREMWCWIGFGIFDAGISTVGWVHGGEWSNDEHVGGLVCVSSPKSSWQRDRIAASSSGKILESQ